jgi:hypothetical protein
MDGQVSMQITLSGGASQSEILRKSSLVLIRVGTAPELVLLVTAPVTAKLLFQYFSHAPAKRTVRKVHTE